MARSFRSMGPDRRKGITIKRREYFANLNGSVNFATQRYEINPGLAKTFPWLHNVADEWQYYKVTSMKIIYVASSPSTATGTVILAPEYNVYHPPPITETEATNTANATEDVTWKTNSMSVDPKYMHESHEKLMVRQGAVENLPAYDGFNVNISTSGQSSTAQIGKLWIEYNIHFSKPQTLKPNQTFSTAMLISNTASTSMVNGVWTSVSALTLPGDNHGAYVSNISTTVSTNDTFDLPKGVWKLGLQGSIQSTMTTHSGWNVSARLVKREAGVWVQVGLSQVESQMTGGTVCTPAHLEHTMSMPVFVTNEADGSRASLGVQYHCIVFAGVSAMAVSPRIWLEPV